MSVVVSSCEHDDDSLLSGLMRPVSFSSSGICLFNEALGRLASSRERSVEGSSCVLSLDGSVWLWFHDGDVEEEPSVSGGQVVGCVETPKVKVVGGSVNGDGLSLLVGIARGSALR